MWNEKILNQSAVQSPAAAETSDALKDLVIQETKSIRNEIRYVASHFAGGGSAGGASSSSGGASSSNLYAVAVPPRSNIGMVAQWGGAGGGVGGLGDYGGGGAAASSSALVPYQGGAASSRPDQGGVAVASGSAIFGECPIYFRKSPQSPNRFYCALCDRHDFYHVSEIVEHGGANKHRPKKNMWDWYPYDPWCDEIRKKCATLPPAWH